MDVERARTRLSEERTRLEALRSNPDLTRLVAHDRETGAELSTLDQHPADAGTEAFERTKDLSILNQIEMELIDVDRASAKLEEGTYGTCEACGKPISEERLEALPATRYCVEDMARIEHEVRANATDAPHGFF